MVDAQCEQRSDLVPKAVSRGPEDGTTLILTAAYSSLEIGGPYRSRSPF